METSQRYIVRELTGYSGIGTDQLTTDFYVLDRWYCHDVVALFRGFKATVGQRRLEAQATARRFEFEHRRELGRVA